MPFALPPPRLHHSGSSNEYYEVDCPVWVEQMQIGRGGFGKVTLWKNQVCALVCMYVRMYGSSDDTIATTVLCCRFPRSGEVLENGL